MAGVNFVPRINVAAAWKRIYLMTKPISASQATTFRILKWTCVLSWPVMAAFTKYTMEMDVCEHHARAKLVDKSYPYMNNPNNIVYTWGNPCTLFDFECAYKYRESLSE